MAVAPPSVILLAGERSGADPVARLHGVPSKILVPVGTDVLIDRVMRTLDRCQFSERVIAGPRPETLSRAPMLQAAIDRGDWRWVAPAESPAASVLAALDAIPAPAEVLVTTADHALLDAALVGEFVRGASVTGADLTIGFVRYGDVMAAFPEGRRTGWRFADDRYCGCNLFYFARPEARAVAALWRRIERDRKQPWKVVRLLGPIPLLRFLGHRLTLADALTRLGEKAGATIAPLVLGDPRAAVDVDTVDDWRLVDRLVRAD